MRLRLRGSSVNPDDAGAPEPKAKVKPKTKAKGSSVPEVKGKRFRPFPDGDKAWNVQGGLYRIEDKGGSFVLSYKDGILGTYPKFTDARDAGKDHFDKT